MMAGVLTIKEREWIRQVNALMARCPSPEKIGFYTIGDPSIYLYDLRRIDEVTNALDSRNASDWCTAVQAIGAGFDAEIEFPSAVESTAG